jgi:hypothetical protein
LLFEAVLAALRLGLNSEVLKSEAELEFQEAGLAWDCLELRLEVEQANSQYQ